MMTGHGTIDPLRAGIAADAPEWVRTHYGDPLREQRSLERGEAVAPLGDRAVVAVSGEDRLTWLDSITSQRVVALAPGESTELLVLDPQGRIEHAAAVVDDGATTWLIVDEADAAPLTRWLTMMRFRSRVEVTPREDLLVVGFAPGGGVEPIVRECATVMWADPWASVTPGGWQYATAPAHPGAERRWSEALVPGDAVEAIRGLPLAGTIAADALRVAAWRPRWSREVDDRAIPHEADWLRSAVHLNKGCYRGQETVAKVHNLGHPPRRLVMLHLDGSDSVLPEPGAGVFSDDAEAGHVTSAALHHELGPIALALVSRRTPGDVTLQVAAGDTRIAAAQEIIVPADAGATAEVPRLTRLSRRPLASDR